jgi:hypothetical protein
LFFSFFASGVWNLHVNEEGPVGEEDWYDYTKRAKTAVYAKRAKKQQAMKKRCVNRKLGKMGEGEV